MPEDSEAWCVRGLTPDRTSTERRGTNPRSPGSPLQPPGLLTEGLPNQQVRPPNSFSGSTMSWYQQRAADGVPSRSRKHHARGSHTRAAAAHGRGRGRGARAVLSCCQKGSGGRRSRDRGVVLLMIGVRNLGDQMMNKLNKTVGVVFSKLTILPPSTLHVNVRSITYPLHTLGYDYFISCYTPRFLHQLPVRSPESEHTSV